MVLRFVLVLLSLVPVALPARDVHTKMGTPGEARRVPGDPNDVVVRKGYFALSYNASKGTPNWVSWRLAKEDLGSAPRRPFRPDLALAVAARILPGDYTRSGFDRGHLCPHSDRSKDVASSDATFAMSNMMPQSAENNRGAWASMEIYLRGLVAEKNKVCYIVAGPAGQGGVGAFGPKDKIKGKIVVPSKTWKVVLVLDRDVERASELTERSKVRLIAVVVPNDRSVGLAWDGYRRSLEDVERLAGYRFFDRVPKAVLGPIAKRPDAEPIPRPVPRYYRK